ncbi:MAG: hypothetical protein WKF77_23140 [Planctomycetaceae bacterium]
MTLIRNPNDGSLIASFLELQWLVGYGMLLSIVLAEWLFFDEFRTRFNYIARESCVSHGSVLQHLGVYQTAKFSPWWSCWGLSFTLLFVSDT